MSEDYPKTLGDCWEIFERNGIKFNHTDDNLFPNARKILELEKQAKKLGDFTTAELVSELRTRDGVEVFDAPIRDSKLINSFANVYPAIILRITD